MLLSTRAGSSPPASPGPALVPVVSSRANEARSREPPATKGSELSDGNSADSPSSKATCNSLASAAVSWFLAASARCAQSAALSSHGRVAISPKSRSRRTADLSADGTGGLAGFAVPRARPLPWLRAGSCNPPAGPSMPRPVVGRFLGRVGPLRDLLIRQPYPRSSPAPNLYMPCASIIAPGRSPPAKSVRNLRPLAAMRAERLSETIAPPYSARSC